MQQDLNFQQSEELCSAIVVLNRKPAPTLKSTALPWIIGIPLMLAVVLSAIAYLNLLHYPVMMSVLIIAMIVCFVFIWRISSARDQTMQYTICLVQDCRAELGVLHKQLTDYLQRLDARAPKYFNYVTSSKVSAYFNLIQIKNALEERLALVDKFFLQDSDKALISAYKYMQLPLEFKASVITNTAQERSIPITEIEEQITEFVDQLESVFEDIEKQIQIEQECQYYDDETLNTEQE